MQVGGAPLRSLPLQWCTSYIAHHALTHTHRTDYTSVANMGGNDQACF